MIAREAMHDETLPSGLKIKRGMHVWISPWLLHNDEEKWAAAPASLECHHLLPV